MVTNKPMKSETTPAKPMSPWEGSFSFPLFQRLSRELETMFDRFGIDRFGFERPIFENMPSLWTPAVEMLTKGNEFVVKAALPGLKKEEITVEVAENQLVLRGERKHEQEEKKENFFKSEWSYGTFCRTIPLPEGVNPELAKATMKEGVLEITMPITKVEPTKRTLEIVEPTPAVTTKAA